MNKPRAYDFTVGTLDSSHHVSTLNPQSDEGGIAVRGKPDLSIIVVNYKSDNYLDDCLRSIGESSLWEIIIVDNNKTNVGYGAGCNKGAKMANGRYLLFLNPDTKIVGDSLKKMIDFMKENPDVAVLGPKLYEKDGKTRQLSFCRFPDPITAIFVYSPLKSTLIGKCFWKRFIAGVDAVSGAALLVRKEVFEKVKGFDERYFLYFEENDLCLRIKKLGMKIVFFPESEIIHYGRGSTVNRGEAEIFFKESRNYFFKKNYGIITSFLMINSVGIVENLVRLTHFFKKAN